MSNDLRPQIGSGGGITLIRNLWFADDIDALRKAGDELCEELLTARLAREARGDTIARRPRMERWSHDDFYNGADDYGL